MSLWAMFGIGPLELILLVPFFGAVFLGSVAGAGVLIFVLWQKSSRKDDPRDREPPQRD